jgi:hypothetical protein
VTGFASWAFASLIIVLRVQVITATLTISPSSCHFSSRIAIWNLQRIFLLLSVFLWLAGLATIILSASCIPNCMPDILISRVCVGEALITVRHFRWILLSPYIFWTHARTIKDVRVVWHKSGRVLRLRHIHDSYCGCSSGRHSAPHEHANRTLAVCAQEFNGYMVSPLPTGDALPFLFHKLLKSFKCIIWIILTYIAGVLLVVGVFLSLDSIVLTFSGLPNC